jgi:hypothetical protein
MYIEESKQTTTLNTNVAQAHSFNIKMDANLYEALSASIYSDKEKAVVREYTTNAIDANRSAGVELPVEITISEAEFSVADRGKGMGYRFVTRLFSTYNWSDKRKEETAIGGFGMGSKAAFAYSDTFIVNTIVRRKEVSIKSSYVCHKGQGGVPVVMRMSRLRVGNDEETGTRISVPLKEKADDIFRLKACELAQDMDFPVKLNGYLIEKYTPIIEQEGSKTSECPKVILQGVAYPLSLHEIFQDFTGSKGKYSVYGLSVALKVKPGVVMPTLSREAIKWTEESKDRIRTLYLEAVDSLKQKLREKLDKESTLLEKNKIASGLIIGTKDSIKWRGMDSNELHDYLKQKYPSLRVVWNKLERGSFGGSRGNYKRLDMLQFLHEIKEEPEELYIGIKRYSFSGWMADQKAKRWYERKDSLGVFGEPEEVSKFLEFIGISNKNLKPLSNLKVSRVKNSEPGNLSVKTIDGVVIEGYTGSPNHILESQMTTACWEALYKGLLPEIIVIKPVIKTQENRIMNILKEISELQGEESVLSRISEEAWMEIAKIKVAALDRPYEVEYIKRLNDTAISLAFLEENMYGKRKNIVDYMFASSNISIKALFEKVQQKYVDDFTSQMKKDVEYLEGEINRINTEYKEVVEAVTTGHKAVLKLLVKLYKQNQNLDK